MSNSIATAGEARRLASADVGTSTWAKELAASVLAAEDSDLGVHVVARAVLTRAIRDRDAERARQQTAQDERLKAERAAAERRQADAHRARRHDRFRRAREQLPSRLIMSAIYSAWVGAVGLMSETFSFWTGALHLFGICLVTAGAAMVFDWFAYSGSLPLPRRDPSGRLRALAVATAVMLSIGVWLSLVAPQAVAGSRGVSWGETFQLGPFTSQWVFAALPVYISIGWIAGGLAVLLVGAGPRPPMAARIERAQTYLRPFAWLGPISAASALLLGNIPQLASYLRGTFVVPQLLPVSGAGASTTTLIILGMLALALHEAAPQLTARAVPLGLAACVTGPFLGLLSLLVNPVHIVTWLVEWGIGVLR